MFSHRLPRYAWQLHEKQRGIPSAAAVAHLVPLLEARAQRVDAAGVGLDGHLWKEVRQGGVAQVSGDLPEVQQVLQRVLHQQPRDNACAARPTISHFDSFILHILEVPNRGSFLLIISA